MSIPNLLEFDGEGGHCLRRGPAATQPPVAAQHEGHQPQLQQLPQSTAPKPAYNAFSRFSAVENIQ